MRLSADNNMTTSTTDASHARRTYDSSSLTSKKVMIDVASWWCYVILNGENLHLYDEFENILELSGPIPLNSTLHVRLRCIAIWQDLLKELNAPGNGSGKHRFESIQDKLILLHKDSFPKTRAKKEYNEVLRMLQTHNVLSKMYEYFKTVNNHEKTNKSGIWHETNKNNNEVLDQCNADFKNLYLRLDDGMPTSLLDLVDKKNGWDASDRMDHITQIAYYETSPLTHEKLKSNIQSLLLHWFEHEIFDTDDETGKPIVTELLEKRYRGIGFGGTSGNGNERTPSSPVAVRDAAAELVADVSTDVYLPTGIGSPSSRQRRQRTKTRRASMSPGNRRQNPKKQKAQYPKQKLDVSFDTNEDEDENGYNLLSNDEYEEQQNRLKARHKRKKRILSIVRRNIYGVTTMYKSDDENWSQEQDDALIQGMKWNGYGNWSTILSEQKDLLGSKGEIELRSRANILLKRR
ncbi:unnamed protein product [Pseudo-nitzschia multistriata]|uniref:Myb-like domain-containing protein n=1 Tax=Pseudo-nitzschia multistriata TaxID=183589 RepID=A0A448Z9R3_9STRA|nr:unnamed protein product [Pseudo-nitzschia multistriata]